MNTNGLKEIIAEKISTVLEAYSLELVDIEMKNRKGQRIVTIYIDKDGGVKVKDCAELSNIIGEIFDVEDLIPYKYVLEISSPGLDRPLTKKNDYERNIGKKIEFFVIDVNNKKLKGIIKQVMNNSLEIETPDGLLDIPFSNIKQAKHSISKDNVN